MEYQYLEMVLMLQFRIINLQKPTMIKNIIFILLLSMPVCVFSQQDLYTITFKDINNNQVSINTFSGKKIVISVIDAANPNERYLKMLDTLYRNNNTTVQVIAVPACNFANAISNDSLVAIYNRLHLGYIISKPAKGKKADGDQQHSLLQWLTHSDSNRHFENDVEEPGQLYVVSESGSLYAVMKSKILPTSAAMNKIISRQAQ
jgi:glutathione peroxidase-family protein